MRLKQNTSKAFKVREKATHNTHTHTDTQTDTQTHTHTQGGNSPRLTVLLQNAARLPASCTSSPQTTARSRPLVTLHPLDDTPAASSTACALAQVAAAVGARHERAYCMPVVAAGETATVTATFVVCAPPTSRRRPFAKPTIFTEIETRAGSMPKREPANR